MSEEKVFFGMGSSDSTGELSGQGGSEEGKKEQSEIPSFKDRKRFLECLAIILASSSHDWIDDANANNNNNTNGEGEVEIEGGIQSNSFDSSVEGSTQDEEISFLENQSAQSGQLASGSLSPREENQEKAFQNGVVSEEDENVVVLSVKNRFQEPQQQPPVRGVGKPTSSQLYLFAAQENHKRQEEAIADGFHRRRRHAFAKQLLLSSADHLLLDISTSLYVETTLLPSLDPLLRTPSYCNDPNDIMINDIINDNSSTVPLNEFNMSSSEVSERDSSQRRRASTSTTSSSTTYKSWEDNSRLKSSCRRLSPGAGFRCLALYLFQHLLSSKDGYDARTRHAMKTLAVAVLVHQMNSQSKDVFAPKQGSSEKEDDEDQQDSHAIRVERATRQFEALERSVADRLLQLAVASQKNGKTDATSDTITMNTKKKNVRDHVVRGLKVGAVGVVAGTLLAVTGGMAAPGIVAGLAAVTVTVAPAAVSSVLWLASYTSIVTLFGVAGGGLAAHKMNRRTAGLTEFAFFREDDHRLNNITNGGGKQSAGADSQDQAAATKSASTDADKLQDPEGESQAQERPSQRKQQPELFRTICVSGWLRDNHDYQRPWGISPWSPELKDKLELLQRFYKVYNPELIPKCEGLLLRWKDQEEHFYELLRQKYGSDPSKLFPKVRNTVKVNATDEVSDMDKAIHIGPLSAEQEMVLDKLVVEICMAKGGKDDNVKEKKPARAQRRQHDENQREQQNEDQPEKVAFPRLQRFGTRVKGWNSTVAEKSQNFIRSSSKLGKEFLSQGSYPSFPDPQNNTVLTQYTDDFEETFDTVFPPKRNENVVEQQSDDNNAESNKFNAPRHLDTVWDYGAIYGGELYTVKWESVLLRKLCKFVQDMVNDVARRTGAIVTLGLLATAAIPAALINATHLIDGTWTLVISRADEAGRELARSLLWNKAGHRPVTLVGYSFGARVIYSCLLELARYQEKWEEQQHFKSADTSRGGRDEDERNNRKMLDDDEDEPLEIEPASIVEDAILMGAPLHLNEIGWKKCRRMVAGRLCNVYSRRDRILSLMFKMKQLSLRPICGVSVVAVPGVENVDLTDIVSGHEEYTLIMGSILRRLRLGQPVRAASPEVEEAPAPSAPNDSTTAFPKDIAD